MAFKESAVSRALALAFAAVLVASCASLPSKNRTRFTFPRGKAFVDEPVDDRPPSGDPAAPKPEARPYSKLGLVRTRIDYPSLDPDHEEDVLCSNYYNKAVRDLVKRAEKQHGDAVIDVRSVVFLEDGTREVYKTAQCSDDGENGQILLEGIAVKWRKPVLPKPKPPGIPEAKPAAK